MSDIEVKRTIEKEGDEELDVDGGRQTRDEPGQPTRHGDFASRRRLRRSLRNSSRSKRIPRY